jgi:hypothetical protein
MQCPMRILVRSTVNFVFVCGWWTQKYRVSPFECWWCGEDNSIPDPPWTEAD